MNYSERTILNRLVVLQQQINALKKQSVVDEKTFSTIQGDVSAIQDEIDDLTSDAIKLSKQVITKVPLYIMPDGNLTDGFDAVTKGGAMSTATITKSGNYDNVVVAGSDQNSYAMLTNRIFTVNPIYVHVRIKVKAIGGTAPILGIRVISASAPYVNFVNQQGYIYFNLSTGVATSSFSSHAATSANGWVATVATNDIVDLYFEWTYNKKMSLSISRDSLSGEVSTRTLTWTPSGNVGASIFTPALIMADGTYQLLRFEIGAVGSLRPKVALVGDSLVSGAAIPYTSTIVSKLAALIPYSIANFGAPAAYLAGMQATQRDVLALAPEVVFFDATLDALYNNDCDPLDSNYAVWGANFNRYVNTYINAGIEPILFITYDNVLYSNSRPPNLLTYWTTNFPGRKSVTREATDGGYDSTTFHYNDAANTIIVNKLITELEALGVL